MQSCTVGDQVPHKLDLFQQTSKAYGRQICKFATDLKICLVPSAIKASSVNSGFLAGLRAGRLVTLTKPYLPPQPAAATQLFKLRGE